MNQLILTVGGKEFRLKPTAAPVEAAEKRIGDMSLLDAFSNIDRTACFCAILWAGLQKYNHGMTWEKTLGLIDDIADNGFLLNGKEYADGSVNSRGVLALEVLKVGGFFTQKTVEEMDAAMQPMNVENTEP